MPNTKYIGGVLQGPSGPLPPDLEVRLVGRVRAGVGRACLPLEQRGQRSMDITLCSVPWTGRCSCPTWCMRLAGVCACPRSSRDSAAWVCTLLWALPQCQDTSTGMRQLDLRGTPARLP